MHFNSKEFPSGVDALSWKVMVLFSTSGRIIEELLMDCTVILCDPG